MRLISSGKGAIYVDKILKGAKPTNSPVQHPTKSEMIKALGLEVPTSILLRADDNRVSNCVVALAMQ